MPIPPQIADRLGLDDGLASLVVTLAGAVTLLSGEPRPVDLLTTGAGALGAAGSLTSALARKLPSRRAPDAG
ncbi:hypothetical protein, partial [Roseisolibacter sp. H3M3-2]|uniref:hypothetical protein n=1 Tax=Roseisolibacter sp. H3M3-2 TaxID=3031323 RepID=UPI0023DCE27B